MTYTVLALAPANTAPVHARVDVDHGGVSNRTGLVVDVPAEQAYYWSRAWQANERLASAELACGEGREFSDVEAALAWLDSDD